MTPKDSSTPHTPGPWTVYVDRESDRIIHLRYADGTTIDINVDDARLIAAAPELLEALERLLDNGDDPHPLTGRDPTVRREDIGPARAAIAKARGKQEAAQAESPGRPASPDPGPSEHYLRRW